MREIKFRVFYDNRMLEVERLMFEDNLEYIRTFDDLIIGVEECNLMQYTGLKDKNGKEIYEGDIIKIIDSGKDIYICEVTFGKIYRCSFELKNKSLSGGYVLLYRKSFKYEVIGNIYENKELLK